MERITDTDMYENTEFTNTSFKVDNCKISDPLQNIWWYPRLSDVIR